MAYRTKSYGYLSKTYKILINPLTIFFAIGNSFLSVYFFLSASSVSSTNSYFEQSNVINVILISDVFFVELWFGSVVVQLFLNKKKIEVLLESLEILEIIIYDEFKRRINFRGVQSCVLLVVFTLYYICLSVLMMIITIFVFSEDIHFLLSSYLYLFMLFHIHLIAFFILNFMQNIQIFAREINVISTNYLMIDGVNPFRIFRLIDKFVKTIDIFNQSFSNLIFSIWNFEVVAMSYRIFLIVWTPDHYDSSFRLTFTSVTMLWTLPYLMVMFRFVRCGYIFENQAS